MNQTTPTTFLEYVCTRLMGPPTRTAQPGEAYWPCPRCGHAKFHTRPHNPPHKDRVYCWTCQWWGDACDVLKELLPDECRDYGIRVQRLRELQADFDREIAAGTAGAATEAQGTPHPSPSLPRGAGSKAPSDHSAVQRAFADLSADEMLTLAQALVLAVTHKAPLEALAKACFAYCEWTRQLEMAFPSEMVDPEPEPDEAPRNPARPGRNGRHYR